MHSCFAVGGRKIIRIKNGTLYIITLLFCFLSFFTFKAGTFAVPYYYIVVSLFLFMQFYFNKKTINRLVPFLKTKSAQILGLLCLWIVIGIVISLFRGLFYLNSFISSFLGSFIVSQFMVFILMLISVPYIISFRKISKVLLLIYLAIFSLGIVEFIADIYNINPLLSFFHFLVNKNELLGVTTVNFSFLGSPRLASIFNEPSFLAYFIVLSLPIIYNLCTAKDKIFKSKLVDIIIKKLTFLLMIFCLMLSQSPIFLVFAMIIAISLLFKKMYDNRKYFTKNILVILGLMLIILTGSYISYVLNINFTGLDVTYTYLSRILNVLTSGKLNMATLAFIEPSLASRIGNFTAQFMIFIHNPVFGVGYGNTNSLWAQAVFNLPFPITEELQSNAILGVQKCGSSIAFKFLAETGIVGAALLYWFLFNLLAGFKKKINLYKGIEKHLIIGLKYSLIIMIATSFYDSYNIPVVLGIYLGLIQAMLLNEPVNEENVIPIKERKKENG